MVHEEFCTLLLKFKLLNEDRQTSGPIIPCRCSVINKTFLILDSYWGKTEKFWTWQGNITNWRNSDINVRYNVINFSFFTGPAIV